MYRLMSASGFSELSVRQLLARRRRLAGGLSDPERRCVACCCTRAGGVFDEGCHCRRGELHGPYPYLAVYSGGRSRTIYVPAALASACEAHVEVTHRNEQVLAEISQINLELLRRRASR